MFDILSLLIGFVPLIWGANILVNSTASLVNKFGFSNFSVGLTIVAFGTSAPEMSVNIFAAINHDNFITMGNVLGSNLFNISIILGIVTLTSGFVLTSKLIRLETFAVFIVAIILIVFSNDTVFRSLEYNVITRKEGLILLVLFGIYLFFLFRGLIKRSQLNEDEKGNNRLKSSIKIFMGLGLLIAGGQLIVFSAQNLAEYLTISERLVAIIIISVGTSLPELVTATLAMKKGNVELVFGNLVGSTIFNGLFVLGISALINPVRINEGIQYDLIVHLIICGLLLLYLINKPLILKKVNGALLILIYLCYVSYLFIMMN